MTGLAIIVVGADPERAQAALGIASAAAALGRETAILFDKASISTLSGVVEALATALALGVAVTACATGLADLGVQLPAGVEAGGMVGFVAANPDAQLLAV